MSREIRKRGIAVAAPLIVSLLVSAPSFAQSTPPPGPSAPPTAPVAPSTGAAAHFQHGLDLFQEQDYSGALVELRRAYEITPTYKMLFNIAQVCYQLNDYACALKSFEEYLKVGGPNISSERRTEVDREMAKLRARVGRLEIVTSEPGATVAIDDVVVGTTPLSSSIIVSTGRRRVTATKEGFTPVNRVVEVAGTDSMRVSLDFVSGTAGAARVEPRYEPRWNVVTWVGVGAAVAFGAGSGITGALALKDSHDLQSMRYAAGGSNADIVSKQSDVKGLAVASDVLLAASLVTLGATIVYTLVHSPRRLDNEPRPAAGLQFSTQGAVLGARF